MAGSCPYRQKWCGIAVGLVLTLTAITLTQRAHQQLPNRVDIGGRHMRTLVAGQGEPTVVLETIGAAPLEVWAKLQREISRFATVFVYDHAGHWGSDPGPTPRDARQVAKDLRATLKASKLDPPFVLVGYSLGGPYSRVFAGMYPDDWQGWFWSTRRRRISCSGCASTIRR